MQIFTCIASFLVLLFYALAFDELIFFANAELSVQDMRKAGREQYQILQERGKLPKYGECWKAALEHVEESCRQLTEETQSDVALHITNCFLEMSGHDTYSCGTDKKPNLRAICLQSMTDRAFNVYTEFFTQAQNICWFLRGTLWQETIEENTRKVGKQLDKSSRNQETLLKNQQHSLELQEKMLKYGEEMDAIMMRFMATTKQHHELIQVLSTSVSNLQSWLIGEVSWLDSAVFYLVASLVVIFVTSSPRAMAARLPMLILLGCNIFFERILCYGISHGTVMNAELVHENYYTYVSYMRYAFIAFMGFTLGFHALMYKDYLIENHLILETIQEGIRDLQHSLQPVVMHAESQQQDRAVESIERECLENIPRARPRKNGTNVTPRRTYYLDLSRGSTESTRSNGRYNLRVRHDTGLMLNSFE